MRKWLVCLALLPCCLQAEDPLPRDDFRNGLAAWVVEQQPGGSVTVTDGVLTIADKGGCTVWFREALTAPVTIRYRAKVSSAARVSDLNCFWMASDPTRPDDLFGPGHTRTGKFATYDSLRTYYVGYGGNTNSTTRFRRYAGTGARPLLPEHDRTAPEFLLKPDHVYEITLVAGADGRVQFIRDGEVVFDWTDPQPLRSGWFGLRTVDSRIEIRAFRVHRGVPPSAVSR
ncbi:hypothetical protein ESB00_01225 [Oleiharenicola lentus]|uniref:DUF6250 domain-containing protein n=1 Tax=Oleiharenicola lentus TaxID=2508720 RepID=A0A4Q1C726_9BACT|nr:DUF6250 domain-containing protein [Oleiharenicola lentus]RXK54552.1 hypothetical protein ESB00_01225 [Oleiharenicola lentus]